MEQEVNLKITCIAVQTSEKAGQAFVGALKKFSMREQEVIHNISQKEKHNENNGKLVKIKDLRKDGSEIEFIDMGKEDDLKDFRKYARKYNVSYSMEKNKATDPPTYLIYFKAKDGAIINQAINAYVADKMKSKEEDKSKGIKERLIISKEKAAKQVSKVRNKEQVR